jgi:hypothetical protein
MLAVRAAYPTTLVASWLSCSAAPAPPLNASWPIPTLLRRLIIVLLSALLFLFGFAVVGLVLKVRV